MSGRRRVSVMLVAAGIAALVGCRGDVSSERPRQFLPDLDDQPKLEPQGESRFFAEHTDEHGLAYGPGARRPVEGTVAFGRRAHAQPISGADFAQRDELLRPNHVIATGWDYQRSRRGFVFDNDTGRPRQQFVDRIPIPVDAELLRLGEKGFNINCLPCHGKTGHGDGMVGSRWAYVLPNFHDEKYQPGGELGQDGYLFHVIRNGLANPGGSWKLKMPSYARKLTIEETWAVVAYTRALQRMERVGLADLPTAARRDLEGRRVAPASSGSKGGAS